MSGISKLVIKAYSDDSFASLQGEFSAPINPDNIKITSSVDYAVSQGMGSTGTALQYNVAPPRVLSFKLIFDNTGVIPGSQGNVKDQLDNLTNLIYNIQEDINSPYGIRITWGIIDFKGKLSSFETSYTLFQSDGSPVRAEAYIEVMESVPESVKGAQSIASQAASVQSSAIAGATSGAAAGGAAGAVAGTNNQAPTSSNETEDTAPSETENEVAGAAVGGGTGVATGAAAGAATGAAAGAATGATPGAAETPPGAATETPPGATTGTPNEGSALQQVQEGDTVPGIANKSLGDPNFAKDLGKLNGLDSLRDLAAGLALAVPLSAAALLLGLLALLEKYAKEAWKYLESKAKEGKNKAIEGKNYVQKKL